MEITINGTSQKIVRDICLTNPTSKLLYTIESLLDGFLSGSLSHDIKSTLTSRFNNYYQTALSIEQLKEVFSSAITLQNERLEILRPILSELE